MKYIIFVIDNESRSGSADEGKAIDAFNTMLRDQGYWVLAAGLETPSNAFLIDNRSSQQHMSNGSLFDVEDFYSGMWVIEAPDLPTAQELAKHGSAACNRRVELRPFL